MTKQAEYHVTKLNLARHCLNFLISAIGINVLHLPYYICPVIWQSVKHWNPNCKLKFYHIDDSFFPLKKFNREDYILYPNYFGISWSNIQILAMKYPNLIVDNAQAFFAPPAGIASFYSLRKFYPAPSGAYLYTKQAFVADYPKDNTSINIDLSNYNNFLSHELFLDTQPPLIMSDSVKLTAKPNRTQRISKFYTLHKKYKNINRLKVNLTENDVPFVYPCLTDSPEKLVKEFEKEGKTILRYWKELPSDFPEAKFYSNLVPIPLA